MAGFAVGGEKVPRRVTSCSENRWAIFGERQDGPISGSAGGAMGASADPEGERIAY